jgi:hypothetical protein
MTRYIKLKKDLPIDSANCLSVMARIPGGVKHNDTIRTYQVDAEASSTGRN